MPCLTEDQIEVRVERMMDNIDRRFMAGLLSQKAYNAEVADLRRWSDGQYFANKRIGEAR